MRRGRFGGRGGPERGRQFASADSPDGKRKAFYKDRNLWVSNADGSAAAGLANLLAASMTTPSDAFSRDQRQLRMLAAIDTLPEDQREALRLRYLVGLSSKEIAKKINKTDGATRVMISRALARLHEMLAE